MISSSFPISSGAVLVADASVVINLNASGRALEILRAHQASVVVTEQAFADLAAWADNGHGDDKKVQSLIDGGAVSVSKLGEIGNLIYSSLVDGKTVDTLDDGEAATVGYAYETGAIAIIDEMKAKTICETNFPTVRFISTVDLMADDAIGSALGDEGRRRAIINALRDARMPVPSYQLEKVVAIIGDEAAAASGLIRSMQNRLIR